ncbi:peptidase M76 family-domain-containing protein [Schizophyllum commune]
MSDKPTSSTAAPSSSAPPSLPDPSELSTFERWRRNMAYVTGIGMSEEERKLYTTQIHLKRCEERKYHLMQSSPGVVFMLKQLKLAGCELPENNFVCAPCDSVDRAGGYKPGMGAIVLCAGHIYSKDHQEHTMMHEMIHLFDECRFKLDWSNLRHHACTEIRANSLSGDCRYLQEMQRGNFSFTKNHQACVRERAIISVSKNKSCPDMETARRAVNEVFDSCFVDTRPFDEIY